MAKTSIGPQIHIPMVVSILGTMYQDRPNFMALGWQCRANFQPPMIAVGVHSGHATHAGIEQSGSFSACFPPRSMMEETDLVGILSGDKWDKSDMFTVFTGATGAPMIEQCTLCLECEVHKSVDLDPNTLFIGEIKDAFAEESVLTEQGAPDLSAMDPLLLTMPDNRYWSVGRELGKAWKVGRGLQVRLEAEGRIKQLG